MNIKSSKFLTLTLVIPYKQGNVYDNYDQEKKDFQDILIHVDELMTENSFPLLEVSKNNEKASVDLRRIPTCNILENSGRRRSRLSTDPVNCYVFLRNIVE